jgi:hypothetical protein
MPNMLYKLSGRILQQRTRETLEAHQPLEQAGFRQGFSVDDHLHVVRHLADKCLESGRPLWIARVDIEKDFDNLDFDALWKALLAQGVPLALVEVAQRLYAGQTGRVQEKFAIIVWFCLAVRHESFLC